MGPGIFLIAILGCGEGDAPCQTLRTLDTPYETRAACAAATEDALSRNAGLDAPVIVAQCVAAGTPASLRSGDVSRPAGGRAKVQVSPIRS
ncbi:MAG: hypothetical protein QOH04_691 [Sphingomonadales bacterium]|jgi:hypothetical protein|nr:hypothetical protein [Sphingomonadales bacterium]MEA3034932.1 hypothetical protein [Sphingomonadales bacterium]